LKSGRLHVLWRGSEGEEGGGGGRREDEKGAGWKG